MFEAARAVLRRYIALATFLGSYLILTVVGNLLFFSPIGDQLGRHSVLGFSIRNFKTAGTAGFWILLLLPFIVAPAVVEAVRRIAAPWLIRHGQGLPEPSRVAYLALLLAFYLFALTALWRADAVHLLTRATTYEDALRDRFLLLATLGFWPQMVIKSGLVTLSLFGLIQTLTKRDPFWLIIAAFNLVAVSALLILLNMKWPLVLYYGLNVVAILLYARRPLVPGISFAALAGTAYLLISFALLRVVPMPTIHVEIADIGAQPGHPGRGRIETSIAPPLNETSVAPPLKEAAVMPLLAIFNRMALPFPFYYDVFTGEPGKCGTLVDRIKRKTNPCQPSTLVYQEMFADQFAGIGTAPQAVHITGYALSGWAGALIEIMLASAIMGLFAALSELRGPLVDTASIIGAMAGYFFSQLPFEGPIIYDHGILWCGIVLAFLAAAGALGTLGSGMSREPRTS
ncbi:hypothetical protein [Bradyrhizobium macuxiense]|nr:hypothetical protein [Bradyrhizobium macuxiense]